MVGDAECLRHGLLPRAFVEFGIVEGDAEAAQPPRSQPRGKRRDDGGIEPARQKRTDLDIGAQADAGCILQKRTKLFGQC